MNSYPPQEGGFPFEGQGNNGMQNLPPGPAGPNNEPAMAGNMQTQMWQQQHYMGPPNPDPESGFISAATTQPSSMTGHEDYGSLYDLDTGTPSDVASIASSHPVLNDPVGHIPQLVTSLSDEDPVVVYESLLLVERSVNKGHFNEGFFNALIQSRELVDAIVKAMQIAMTVVAQDNGPSQEEKTAALKRVRTASDILRAMTNTDFTHAQREHMQPRDLDMMRHRRTENRYTACQNILCAGGVAALTHLMSFKGVERIRNNGVVAMHNLLLAILTNKESLHECKSQIQASEGITIMINNLKEPNDKLLAIIYDCLNILVRSDENIKKAILKNGGTQIAIDHVKVCKYDKLTERVIKLLYGLSTSQDNKVVMIESGCMEILADKLKDKGEIPKFASLTMRNISDKPMPIRDRAKLAHDIVSGLQHGTRQGQRLSTVSNCMVGIMSNMAAIDKNMKLAFFNASGIQELANLIGTTCNPENPMSKEANELLERGMSTFKSLTADFSLDPEAELNARRLFINVRGLSILKWWLVPTTPKDILRPMLGILANLSATPACHEALFKEGFVSQLGVILIHFFQRLDEPKRRPGEVSNMQLLQTCLSCVNNLSANPINRDAYRCPNLVNVLKKCLEHPNLNNLRSVTSIMAHMATEPEGALVILKTDTHQLIDREFATVEQVKSRHPTFQNNLNPEKENGIAEIVFNCEKVRRNVEELKKANFQIPNPEPKFSIPPLQAAMPQGPPPQARNMPPNQGPPNNPQHPINGPPPPHPMAGMPPGPGGPPPPHQGFPPQYHQGPHGGPPGHPGGNAMMPDPSMNMMGGPPGMDMHGYEGPPPPHMMGPPPGGPPPPGGFIDEMEMFAQEGPYGQNWNGQM